MGVEAWIAWDRFGANALAWLLTYALHSTVLIGGAWIVACLLARLACRVRALRDLLPAVRDRLWKVALVGGIVTATAQSWFQVGPWQMRFGAETGAQSIVVSTPAEPSPTLTPAGVHTGTMQTLPAVSSAALPTAGELSPAPATEIATTTWIGIVLSLWAVGVALGLARWICQWNRLLRDLDDRTPIRSGLLFTELGRLREAAGSTAPVRLSSAPGISAPITLGLRRAEICVPPRVEKDLRREEIVSLLAHELAHVERRDPAWLVLCRAIEVVFFFQPLNRLCTDWLSDEAEYLSDDWAVMQTGERVGMASCLTEIAGWMVHSDEPRLVAGMAARGSRLTLRVGRLLDEDHEPETTARGTWMTSALAPVGLSAALLVPGVTAAEDDERAHERLADRTGMLELDLARVDESDSDPEVVAEEPAAVDADASLDDLLATLEDEIERLRDELSNRSGGESLRDRLASLEQRVAELRMRASVLRSQWISRTVSEWAANSDASLFSKVFVLDSVSKDSP